MKELASLIAVAVLVVASSSPAAAADLDGTLWRVTLETGPLGPVEVHVAVTEADGKLEGRSLSGALGSIRELPGAATVKADLGQALFAFRAERRDDGYRGALTAPWEGREIALAVDGGKLSGSIAGGLLAGELAGGQVDEAAPIRDYAEVLRALDEVLAARIFDPAALEKPAYRRFRERLGEIAVAAHDDLDLLLGFRWAWTQDPFSHFELRRSPVPAEAMIRSFDDFRVGRQAARLELDGDLAVLTVDTMMGNDTIEQIEAAYEAIAEADPAALIIDLRGNSGGAFAVKPLIEHVIDEPLDVGYFLSNRWTRSHDRLPTATELQAVTPWQGWSISAFWRSVQEDGLLRIRLDPGGPNFNGPVFVVVDETSASATELAADAFRASGTATLVGEPTAGRMLSQSFFDTAEGFVVSLPVADYFSTANGRIEGAGVPVDVEASSGEALDVAKALARRAISP